MNLPKSVVKIGVGAFLKTSLSSVDFLEGVQEVCESVFGECYYLENITIPASVKKIGKNAFEKCAALKSVVIPKDAEVAENAFPEWCKVIRK